MTYGLKVQTQDGFRDLSEISIMREVVRLPYSDGQGTLTYQLPSYLGETNCIPLGISYDGKYPPSGTVIDDTLYYGSAGTIYTNDPTQDGAVVVLQLMGLAANTVMTY